MAKTSTTAKKSAKAAKVSKKTKVKSSTSKKSAVKAKPPAAKKAKKAKTANVAKKNKKAAPKSSVKTATPKAAPKKAKKNPPRRKRSGLPDVTKHDMQTKLESTARRVDAPASNATESFSETVTVQAPVAAQRGKALTVSDCVDAQMVGLGNPNENDRMDTDLHQTEKSMRAFLSGVRNCLAPRFAFDMDNDDFIKSCVTAKVFRLKLLINGRTR